jgi:hypothetical protein
LPECTPRSKRAGRKNLLNSSRAFDNEPKGLLFSQRRREAGGEISLLAGSKLLKNPFGAFGIPPASP